MSWQDILKQETVTNVAEDTLLHYYRTMVKLSDAYKSSNNFEELKKVVGDIMSEMGKYIVSKNDYIQEIRNKKSDLE